MKPTAKHRTSRKRRAAMLALAAMPGLFAAGCTVQPLYAPESRISAPQSAALKSIYIKPVNGRVALETRNALIFLLNGGSGQPSSAAYELSLDVTSTNTSSLVVQITATDGEPTSQTVKVSGGYALISVADGRVVSNRKASALASYDVSTQEFANTRAARDAENRAAHDLAERLRALIAADLSRTGAL